MGQQAGARSWAGAEHPGLAEAASGGGRRTEGVSFDSDSDFDIAVCTYLQTIYFTIHYFEVIPSILQPTTLRGVTHETRRPTPAPSLMRWDGTPAINTYSSALLLWARPVSSPCCQLHSSTLLLWARRISSQRNTRLQSSSSSLPWPLVPIPPQPDCLLIMYQCTHTQPYALAVSSSLGWPLVSTSSALGVSETPRRRAPCWSGPSPPAASATPVARRYPRRHLLRRPGPARYRPPRHTMPFII